MCDKDIENFVYQEISKYFRDIDYYSNIFGVDPKLIISILYVERIQSNLQPVRTFLKTKSEKLSSFISTLILKTAEESEEPLDWINCSRGLCHIKFKIACYLVQKYKNQGILTDKDLGLYRTEPQFAIKIMCAIIKEHIGMWKEFVPDIENKIDILGTLYNISDFKNKKPHSNPQSGGSVLPIIVDGKFIEDQCFGDRVRLVYNSKTINLIGACNGTKQRRIRGQSYGVRNSF